MKISTTGSPITFGSPANTSTSKPALTTTISDTTTQGREGTHRLIPSGLAAGMLIFITTLKIIRLTGWIPLDYRLIRSRIRPGIAIHTNKIRLIRTIACLGQGLVVRLCACLPVAHNGSVAFMRQALNVHAYNLVANG
jgi:hypothetical protein